jgi:hypothetical protein
MSRQKDFGIIQFTLTNIPEHQHIISTTKSFINHRPNDHIVVFNSYSDIINNEMVPILHLSQSKFFYGNLLVFDIESLRFAINCVNKYSIIYYANDMPWEKSANKFFDWKNLFDTKNLNIIAANQIIYDMFAIGYKQPSAIASEFNYEIFQHIL